MHRRTGARIPGLPRALVAAVVVAACTDAVAPRPPLYSFSPNGITRNRDNGSLNQSGRMVQKGFDPVNPHHGDAVIATVYWLGSGTTNIVDSVVDLLNNGTRVGNTYNFVEFVSAGGRSMATYVATNVRNFPDSGQTDILVVRAYLRDSVSDGGIKISSWTGVEDDFATAVRASSSASGTDTGSIPARAGPIAVDAGGLVYTVTSGALQSGSFTGLGAPSGLASLGRGSDNFILEEAAYTVQASAGTVDPEWTWIYDPPARPWLVTTLTLRAAANPGNQAPTANFTSSCTGLACSFTSTSNDPDGTIASYSWTFGDGGTSTAQNPSHTYAAGGTYAVGLTVTDNQGATNAISKNVTVAAENQPPVANFTFSCSELSCSFTSTSNDPDGTIATYSWTFGDGGTSTAQNPSHIYAAGGTYAVGLTVTDNQGATNAISKNVTVAAPNQPPTANFTSSCSGLTCSFTSTSNDPDGTIASYSWTFGDGGTSTAQNPSHNYAAGGTYTVTLRVTDIQGAQSTTTSKTVTVTAPNQPPTANFTFSCSELSCSFTSTSNDPDGTIATYSWTFGDGGTSTAQNPSHTYAAGGTYTVTLRVTDNQGAQSTTTSKTVTVTAPNQAPVVNAGPDETALTGLLYTLRWSFSDGNHNGPWTYTINWGDGSTSTGSVSSEGSFSRGHTYVTLLPRNFTITVTVRDASGASGSDTKVVTVLLL